VTLISRPTTNSKKIEQIVSKELKAIPAGAEVAKIDD